jgi:hypothetical protein
VAQGATPAIGTMVTSPAHSWLSVLINCPFSLISVWDTTLKGVRYVQELLGHGKLETTMVYMHAAEEMTKGVNDCLTGTAQWAVRAPDNVIPMTLR